MNTGKLYMGIALAVDFFGSIKEAGINKPRIKNLGFRTLGLGVTEQWW